MSSPAPTNNTTTTPATTPASTKTKKPTPIKAVAGFSAMANAILAVLFGAVIKGLTGNVAFPTPPVDLVAAVTLLANFINAMQAALDGGKNAKAALAKLRKSIIQDLKTLALYVQNNCNDDMQTFTTSGFQAQQTVKAGSQPVAVPTIRTLDYGDATGQIKVRIKRVDGAKSYNLRYAPLTNGAPGAWTTVAIPTVNKTSILTGLTSGTAYAIQVQALGSLGYTEWSDSMTIMCV